MEVKVVTVGEKNYLAGLPGKRLIQVEEDINSLFGLFYEHHTSRLLLYPENLSDKFFDLSSGEAGMVLGKFSTYQVKAVAVMDLDRVPHSHKFEDLVIELNRGNQFRFYKDLSQAEQWLLKD